MKIKKCSKCKGEGGGAIAHIAETNIKYLKAIIFFVMYFIVELSSVASAVSRLK